MTGRSATTWTGTNVVSVPPASPCFLRTWCTTGGPASEAGFRKRVLYVGTEVLGTHLIGRAADAPDIDDRSLLSLMHRLHASLRHPDDALEAETLMGLVTEQLHRHLGETTPDHPR